MLYWFLSCFNIKGTVLLHGQSWVSSSVIFWFSPYMHHHSYNGWLWAIHPLRLDVRMKLSSVTMLAAALRDIRWRDFPGSWTLCWSCCTFQCVEALQPLTTASYLPVHALIHSYHTIQELPSNSEVNMGRCRRSGHAIQLHGTQDHQNLASCQMNAHHKIILSKSRSPARLFLKSEKLSKEVMQRQLMCTPRPSKRLRWALWIISILVQRGEP